MDCHVMDPAPPNGSKAVTLVLRLCTLGLALASAVVMATASTCTIYDADDDTAATTVTFKSYPPFVYFGKQDDPEAPILPGVVLVVVDVAVQVLVYTSTGAVFAAVTAYGAEIRACAAAGGHFCEQVHRAKLIGLGASLTAGLTAVAKDAPLPFSVWPVSSE
nr:unnamed protein product [Digitaria exilis]